MTDGDSTMVERPTCRATTLDGASCRQFLNLSAEGLCLWHDPQRTAEATAVQSQGGKAVTSRRKPDPIRTVALEDLPDGGRQPETLDAVARWFAWLAVQLATGAIDYRIGRELGHALTGHRTTLEKRDLLAKASEIRAKLDTLKGKPRPASQPESEP